MANSDPQTDSLLSRLRNDRQSGATELALRTLKELVDYLDAIKPDSAKISRLLEALKQARPSMVVIGNAVEKVETRWTENGGPAQAAALAVIRELEEAGDRLLEHALNQVPAGAVIMTHSASSLLARLFRQLAREQRPFSVICTQSSPGMEGHQLAATVNQLEVPVTLITDAQIALFAPQADLVITGCDAWLADDHFVNKSGTHLLALSAREHAVPFWVLADTFRDSLDTCHSVELEELPVSELQAPPGPWITPRNIYFEPTPAHLVTGRISEQGVSLCPAGPPR
ncbi:initiation factor 2B [Marinobacter salinus]|uniref:Initiation factor 2B n=1 Tax=Marinobacter salinus TaxID=1874317 RepID=A0A1D9GPB5_9GAMM|nr:initiation factor 2B [Marinobacter salinus]AOY89361.1 initiation factor 2B [Marinobacter salinus]